MNEYQDRMDDTSKRIPRSKTRTPAARKEYSISSLPRDFTVSRRTKINEKVKEWKFKPISPFRNPSPSPDQRTPLWSPTWRTPSPPPTPQGSSRSSPMSPWVFSRSPSKEANWSMSQKDQTLDCDVLDYEPEEREKEVTTMEQNIQQMELDMESKKETENKVIIISGVPLPASPRK